MKENKESPRKNADQSVSPHGAHGAREHQKHAKDGEEKTEQGKPQETKTQETLHGGKNGALEKEMMELKQTLQRVQADFENSRKRLEREKEEFRKFSKAETLKEFLPLVDSLAEAEKIAEKNGNRETAQGMGKVLGQLMKVFEQNGVKMIETLGKGFDPEMHECLMTASEQGKSDGEVLEEFQKGYTLHGAVLRPAKVKVNRKS